MIKMDFFTDLSILMGLLWSGENISRGYSFSSKTSVSMLVELLSTDLRFSDSRRSDSALLIRSERRRSRSIDRRWMLTRKSSVSLARDDLAKEESVEECLGLEETTIGRVSSEFSRFNARTR